MTDNSYASVLNPALLAELGITRETPEPADGKIVRDERGEPTGLILGAPGLLAPLRGSRAFSEKDRFWALRTMQRKYKKGSIEPGKLADLVVISKDYLTCPEDEIAQIEALMTLVGGKIVFER